MEKYLVKPGARFYIDTCVILDSWSKKFCHNEIIRSYSRNLLKCVRNKVFGYEISEITIKELSRKIGKSNSFIFNKILKQLNITDSLHVVKINKQIREEGSRVERKYGLHFPDNLHLSFAKYLECILVTRDCHLLSVARKDGLKVLRPEELSYAPRLNRHMKNRYTPRARRMREIFERGHTRA